MYALLFGDMRIKTVIESIHLIKKGLQHLKIANGIADICIKRKFLLKTSKKSTKNRI